MPPNVVIPSNGNSRPKVLVAKVHSIISNRSKDNEEQYLVQWRTESKVRNAPLSWHPIRELLRCLEDVQDYLNERERSIATSTRQRIKAKKRRRSDDDHHESRASPMERIQSERTTASASPSPSVSSTTASPPLPDVYNGVLDADQNGFIFCRPDDSAAASQIDVTTVPTPDMLQAARNASVDTAIMYIRNTYVQRLAKLPGLRPIHLFNAVDATTPSLRFRYIPGYVLDEAQGVYRASLETQEGCDQCSWNMGRSIGCEYTKKCSCLEYAPVDEARISDPEMRRAYKALQPGDSTAGFPKKFPYFAVGTKREKEGCLVPFYRNTRWPIFECNDNCNCGSDCRNKNVQFGRKVELEIFRTKGGRGWGLRCREDLHEGQFIDTYRGEVITDAEATRRENTSSKSKASYLFTLDKFAESEGIQDPYVVDGEFMGGPTIFMNHSCDPNCRMYVVSYNKNDPRVYDLAFFAHRDIPAGEELTFHYLDSDDVEAVEEPGEGTVPCLCGTAKCRKWLWT